MKGNTSEDKTATAGMKHKDKNLFNQMLVSHCIY